jgi:hypothetical protein
MRFRCQIDKILRLMDPVSLSAELTVQPKMNFLNLKVKTPLNIKLK